MSVRHGGRNSGYGRQAHPSHRRLAAGERLPRCDTPVTRFRGEARRNMLAGLPAGRGVARCAGNLPNGPTGRSPISAASSGKSRDKRACPIRSSNSSQLSRPSANESWRTLIARSRSATDASMRTYRMVATVTSPQGYPPPPNRPSRPSHRRPPAPVKTQPDRYRRGDDCIQPHEYTEYPAPATPAHAADRALELDPKCDEATVRSGDPDPPRWSAAQARMFCAQVWLSCTVSTRPRSIRGIPPMVAGRL